MFISETHLMYTMHKLKKKIRSGVEPMILHSLSVLTFYFQRGPLYVFETIFQSFTSYPKLFHLELETKFLWEQN